MSDPDRPPAFKLSAESADGTISTGHVYARLVPDGSDPTRLGRYRILRQLGSGGMGVVYLAFDEGLRRRAAVKVLHPMLAAVPGARERFLREARTCARVRSPHVVTIYDVGEDGGVPFLAMEYLRGWSLDGYLRRHGRPLPVRRVMRVGREVAEGLAAAHALGLVHRDIKPGNLWLEAPNGRVKILDFGLAKSVSPADASAYGPASESGTTVGTPAFMSPEQARGEKVDARTDLFSLGAVLYRLATGRLPFEGQSAVALLVSLVTETPPPVRSLNPAVPPPLADLIHRLLAKDPADRPASATEVAAELERIGRRKTRVPVARRAAVALLAGVVVALGWRALTPSDDPVPTAAVVTAPPEVAPPPEPVRNLGERPIPPVLVGVAPPPRPIAEVLPVAVAPSPAIRLTAADVLASADWEWTKPVSLGDAVNTDGEEYDPTLTADGLRMVYLSVRGGKRHLFEARRKTVDQPFGGPWRLDDLGAGAAYLGHPFLSADGLGLWFVAAGPGEPRAIWATRRVALDADWGNAKKLGGAVNAPAGAEYPAVSADGRALYFVRPRDGNRDLWVSRRAHPDAPWGEAEPLGPEVNSAHDEGRLWPLPDGRGLVFSRLISNQWQWLFAAERAGGGWDVRVVRNRSVGGPSFTADGRVVVFRSSSLGGKGGNDLWQMRRVPRAVDPK